MVSRRIAHCTDLMRQVWETSEFEARKGAIAEFNAANRFRKRGIALIPTKFGISFTTKFLNQVSCCSQRAPLGDARLQLSLAFMSWLMLAGQCNLRICWCCARHAVQVCSSAWSTSSRYTTRTRSCWWQAGALVNVYTDGTVLVTHGGVEMGQGLHTKIAQVSLLPSPQPSQELLW